MLGVVARLTRLFNARDCQILLHVSGARTGRPLSMTQTAAQFGLSTERVRQIVNAMKVQMRFFDLPELQSIERTLEQGHILRSNQDDPDLPKVGIVRLAQYLGRDPKIRIEDWAGTYHLIHPAEPTTWQQLASCIFRLSSKTALVSFKSISQYYAERYNQQVSGQYLQAAIDHLAIAHFYSKTEDQTWFLTSSETHAPIKRLDTLLNAAATVTIDGLYQNGMIFSLQYLKFAPPLDVFLSYLDTTGYHIDSLSIKAKPHAAGSKSIKETTKVTMIHILRSHGGAMERSAFLDACVENGIALNTAIIYLSRFSIFRKSKTEVSLAR